MVKNYLLWLIFSILLMATSATACLAGQNSENPPKQKQNNICSLQPEEKLENIKEEVNIYPAAKESKEEEIQEVSPSILNSNFIFYIIYKFKFVDAKSNQYKNDTETNPTIPLLSYSRAIYTAIHSLFEKKY